MKLKLLLVCKKCLLNNVVVKKVVYLTDLLDIKLECKCGNKNDKQFILVSLNGDN